MGEHLENARKRSKTHLPSDLGEIRAIHWYQVLYHGPYGHHEAGPGGWRSR